MNDLLFYKAAYKIQEFKGFDSWEYFGVNRPVHIDDLGTVTLIKHKEDEEFERLKDSYGEMPEGYEGEIALIFKVEAPEGTVFLKKLGTKSSYGFESWNGKMSLVTPVEKTITVYEFI